MYKRKLEGTWCDSATMWALSFNIDHLWLKQYWQFGRVSHHTNQVFTLLLTWEILLLLEPLENFHFFPFTHDSYSISKKYISESCTWKRKMWALEKDFLSEHAVTGWEAMVWNCKSRFRFDIRMKQSDLRTSEVFSILDDSVFPIRINALSQPSDFFTGIHLQSTVVSLAPEASHRPPRRPF